MNNKTMILHSKCFKSTKKLIALIIAIVFFNGCTTSYYYSIDRLYYPSKQIAKDTLFPIKLQIGPIITSNADVYELTNNNYTVKFTQNDIQYGFRKILFNELRANRLFDEVELVKTVTDTKGDVGIILVKTNDIYKVFYVIDASPASKSGILPGDELISIDGQTIDNMNILQLYDKLRGPRGSSVKICIERNDKVQEFVIQRAKVPVLSKRYDYTHEPGNLILLTQLNKAPVSRSSNDEIGATIGYIMLGAAIFTGLIIIGIATSNSDIVSVLSQALSFPRPNIKADVVEEEITDRLNFKFWVFDAVTGDIVTEIELEEGMHLPQNLESKEAAELWVGLLDKSVNEMAVKLNHKLSVAETEGKLTFNKRRLLVSQSEKNKQKIGVTVAEFENIGEIAKTKELGKVFWHNFVAGLIRDNNNLFNIVEREEIKKILGEQSLSLSGLVNKSELKKIGDLLDTDIIIFGSITTQKRITVNLRLVECQSGKVIATLSDSCLSELDLSSVAERISNRLINYYEW